MRGFSAWVLFLVLFIAASGCDRGRVFEGKKDFEDKYWVFNDPAEFEFNIEDVDRSYNILFNIRNTSKYQFQNIYIQYYLEDSIGRLLSRELKNIQLFNQITGVPLGQGIGDILDIEKVVLEDYKFENPGLYRLRIDQFMRQDSLPELLSVGIRVELSD